MSTIRIYLEELAILAVCVLFCGTVFLWCLYLKGML